MASFNFSLNDFLDQKSFHSAVLSSQKNYTPTGEAKALKTTESQGEAKKYLTTWNVSDILQNQPLYKPKGLGTTGFNEVLSYDQKKFLNSSLRESNFTFSSAQSQLTGYDVLSYDPNAQDIFGDGITLNSDTGPITSNGQGTRNNNLTNYQYTGSNRVILIGLTKLGAAYQWAAAGPTVFDCSGFVMWVYQQVGIGLPHYSGAQYQATQRVDRSSLAEGDLVFWGAEGSEHVAIYMGDDKILHTADGVSITNLTGWWKEPSGYGRIR